jgi:hypothetical protein
LEHGAIVHRDPVGHEREITYSHHSFRAMATDGLAAMPAAAQSGGLAYVSHCVPPVLTLRWGYVSPDQLTDLIERVDQQRGGCLCPASIRKREFLSRRGVSERPDRSAAGALRCWSA